MRHDLELLKLTQKHAALKAEADRQARGGPRTEEGKRIASMNAVKTGLTGRTVLLPSDDADAYRAHITAYEKEYKPVGLRETELVQSMADTQWRLQRIPGLESAIYARGRYEFAEAHANEELSLRKALIDLDTHLKYEKQLRNLQLQESRLTRRYEKESAELRQLQQSRDQRERKQETPTREFVFSTPEIAPQIVTAAPSATAPPRS